MRNKQGYNSKVQFVHPALIKAAKAIDNLVVFGIRQNLEKKGRRDWGVILDFVMLRTELLRWRAEKWIREILNVSRVSWEDKWKVKGITYVIFNTINRRRYIGETGKGVLERFRQHIMDGKRTSWRTTYRSMAAWGWHNWIILPIEVSGDCKRRRLASEGYWLRRWGKWAINDRSTWEKETKVYGVIRSEGKRRRGLRRVSREDVRRALLAAVKSNNWGRLTEEEVWALWNMEKKHRLPRKYREGFQRKVVRQLSRYNEWVKGSYTLRLVNGNYDNNEVKRWLVERLRQEKGNRVAEWVSRKMRVVRAPLVRLGDVIRGVGQVHKLDEVKERCRCKEWDEELKVNGHVLCKAEDLRGYELRELLTTNSKIPLTLSKDRFVMGITKGCNDFLTKLGCFKVSKEGVEAMGFVERYEMKEGRFTEERVRGIMGGWSKEEVVIYERETKTVTRGRWNVQKGTKRG